MAIAEDKLIRVDIKSGLQWTNSNGNEAKDELMTPSMLLKVFCIAEAREEGQKPLQRLSLSPKPPHGSFHKIQNQL